MQIAKLGSVRIKDHFALCILQFSMIILSRSPFKSTQPPEIHQRGGKDADEDQHFSIPGPAVFPQRDCPGIDEDGLQIEDDEEHRDEVELDVEADTSRAGGQDAGLVGFIGLLFAVAFAEEV